MRAACLRAAAAAATPADARAVLVTASVVLDAYRAAGVQTPPYVLARALIDAHPALLAKADLQAAALLARAALSAAELERSEEALELAALAAARVDGGPARATRGVRAQAHLGAAASLVHMARLVVFKRLGLREEAAAELRALASEAERLRWLADWSASGAPEYAAELVALERPVASMHAVARVTLEAMAGRPGRVRHEVDALRAEGEWSRLSPEARGELLLYDMLFAGLQAEDAAPDADGRTRLVEEWRAAAAALDAFAAAKPWVRQEHLRRCAEFALRLGDVSHARAFLGRLAESAHDDTTGTDSPTRLRAEAGRAILALATARREGARGDALAAPLQAARDAFRASVRAQAGGALRRDGAAPLRHEGARFLVTELVEATLARHAEDPRGGAEALDVVLLAQELGTLARTAGITATRTEHLRALLAGADHGILLFVEGTTDALVCAVDRDAVVWARTGSLAAVETAATDLWRRVALAPDLDGPDRAAALAEAAAALADALLPAAVRARLARWSRLTLVGSEVSAGGAPLRLLPLDGVPLWRSHALDHLPSGPVGRLLADAAGALPAGDAPLRARVVTAPRASDAALAAGGFDARFPLAPADVRAAVPSGFELLTGAGAHREVVLATAPEPTDLLQLLVHGVVDRRRPSPTGLVLAPAPGAPDDDGILWTAAVTQRAHDARARGERFPRHVVLTACGSGSARVLRGEDGAGSLAGAWLLGGSTSVLEAESDLDAAFALELSEAYLAWLARPGVTPAEALRAALLALDAEAPLDPWFHAGLRLRGLGHRPLRAADDSTAAGPAPRRRPPGSYGPLAVGVALGALSLGLALVLRRRGLARGAR